MKAVKATDRFLGVIQPELGLEIRYELANGRIITEWIPLEMARQRMVAYNNALVEASFIDR